MFGLATGRVRPRAVRMTGAPNGAREGKEQCQELPMAHEKFGDGGRGNES